MADGCGVRSCNDRMAKQSLALKEQPFVLCGTIDVCAGNRASESFEVQSRLGVLFLEAENR